MSVIDGSLRISQCRRVLTHDEILLELRNQVAAKRFSQKAVADRLGIAPARVAEMLKGTRRIQQVEMPVLAQWLGMSEEAEAPLPDGAEPVASVPILGEVPAGNWREAVRDYRGWTHLPAREVKGDMYALYVSGDSMNKIVEDGALIIIDPNDTDTYHRRLFVVRDREGEVTFKRYLDAPGRLEPCSKNPEHQTIPITDRNYEIVGRVKKIILDPDQAAFD